ncbi:MAG: prephenate dehydrogenase [Thermacetogeniaceae bacterium]
MNRDRQDRIAIIGLGVIGGSLGMGLKSLGRYYIVGIDQDEQTLRTARETGAIDEGTSDYRRGVADARVVILSVPVTSIMRIATQIQDVVPLDAVVTDVGSTKAQLVATLEELFLGRFVGGHPMTGSEHAGIGGADQYLFENAIYVLTPTERTAPGALSTVEGLVRELGAIPICLPPREHDQIVAAVSHQPYLLAVALMNLTSALEADHPAAIMLAAGGFRDVTRVASGDPAMWMDIFDSNREFILQTSRQFRARLTDMEGYLERGDTAALAEALAKARQGRQRIPVAIRGFLPAVFEVLVMLPDRPGSIAEIAGILGHSGINIVDIEILRVREGEGGTLRLAFKTEEDATAALGALRYQGVVAKRR